MTYVNKFYGNNISKVDNIEVFYYTDTNTEILVFYMSSFSTKYSESNLLSPTSSYGIEAMN